MKRTLLQRGHSHASCKQAIALAAKALMNKFPDKDDDIDRLELTHEELALVREVIKKFGPHKKE
jgi:hypothetical protein